MSTDDSGDAALTRKFVDQAKALVAQGKAEESDQAELFEPVTPEEVADAREELGPGAGNLSVVRRARERKRGRPPGAKNRRTDDFARYLLQFGRHPAITMMEIQNTDPEVLIENSRREKVHSFNKHGEANVVIETMTYEQAQSLRIRCAENVLPYLESKKPVAVDMTSNGVADLVIEGVTHTRDEIEDIMDADFAPVPDGEEGGE